ncbi:MAG TPA: transcription elongation factor GreA [Candidatus Desulfovibrio intestinipullorum]|uniref:Transcription elongation factor GreA n=1 Tax=Candidatus Desulfovibrio intestinipullorum TaxID=2838536 RepID=A0A9D1TNU0_9BACT|nr:transcription elongation factor GreA [Candidatus Desulfovibrio intestinipullorum]
MAIPISAQGYRKLEKELAQLKEDRPAIIQAIKEAREQGDLRENAGYDAARERQGMNEARINYLENRLAQSTIVDLDKLSGSKVVFGCTVTVVDVDTDEERVFSILGPDEADHARGSISFQSPVGKALLGHEVGEEVTIVIPRGNVVYEITKIEFRGSSIVEG